VRALRLGLLAVGLCSLGATAQAACTNPPGVEGQFIYSVTNHIPNFCDGTTWRSMVGGQTIYSAGGTTNPVFTAANGYFVLTSGTFNGNLGGLTGADASCLTDLTNNNWNGKSAAQGFGVLNAAHVHAWMCDKTTCVFPTANKNYYYASAADPTAGGTYFTTGPDGRMGYNISNGPGTSDNVQWSALSTFNLTTTVWTNFGTNYSTQNTIPYTTSDAQTCAGWTTSATNNGTFGSTSSADTSRWASNTTACTSAKHLICLVNP